MNWNRQSISTIWSLLLVSTVLCGQSAINQQGDAYFTYPIDSCPDFAKISGGKWIPKAIEDFKNMLTKCEINSKTLIIDNTTSVQLIQYLYHFKENFSYESAQQFSFIIDISTKKILWSGETSEYPHGALDDISLKHTTSTPIIELEFFTGGTGGFWEEYYLVGHSGLVKVETSFENSVKSLIPNGYHPRRTRIDIENMTAVIYLATDTDGNCCPSGKLDIKLKFENNDLRLLSGQFSTN